MNAKIAIQKESKAERVFFLVAVIAVGIGSALLGLAFRASIELVKTLFFGGAHNLFASWEIPFYIIFLPAIGGLMVGPLIYFLAREAKGHGVPQVISVVSMGQGEIRSRVVFVKSLASSLTIGSGGSAGAEGPIVQIGAGIGSTLGQLCRFHGDKLKILTCCGAAAGISTIFNAPIAGVLFALEVINQRFSTTVFTYTSIASVTASVISRKVFWGDQVLFPAGPYTMAGTHEIILYLFLGLLAGWFSFLNIKTSHFIEESFEKWGAVPTYIKPAIGGLIVGIIGLFFPQVFGAGYDTISLSLADKLPLGLLFALVFLKLFAVTITLGSGGSGGILVPSLYMGAMLGGAYGEFVHSYLPLPTATSGAYALVGMGAVFAGVVHSPITTIILLLEITQNYGLTLPIMLTSVVSYMVSAFFSTGSIYTKKLASQKFELDLGAALSESTSGKYASKS